MKYIMLKSEDNYFPFIFSREINHNDMNDIIKRLAYSDDSNVFNGAQLIGAGFIDCFGRCFGRSETLKMDSNENDTDIIKSDNSNLGYFIIPHLDKKYPFLYPNDFKFDDVFKLFSKVKMYPDNSRIWSRSLAKTTGITSSGKIKFPITNEIPDFDCLIDLFLSY